MLQIRPFWCILLGITRAVCPPVDFNSCRPQPHSRILEPLAPKKHHFGAVLMGGGIVLLHDHPSPNLGFAPEFAGRGRVRVFSPRDWPAPRDLLGGGRVGVFSLPDLHTPRNLPAPRKVRVFSPQDLPAPGICRHLGRLGYFHAGNQISGVLYHFGHILCFFSL